MYAVQSLKFLSEVGLQRGAIADILTIDILKVCQILYQLLFDLLFSHELLTPIGRLGGVV